MRRAILLFLLAGCEGFWDETDTDPPFIVDDGDTGSTGTCPDGWSEPAAAQLVVNTLQVDNLPYQATLSAEAYNGVAPMCITADGYTVQALLSVGGEPWAWLRSRATEETNVPLTVSDVELVAFGHASAPTFAADGWYQGTWVVRADAGAVVHAIDGAANGDDQVLITAITVSIQP